MHDPALTLASADSVAIAEYIHGIHATMSGQGSPPGRNPTGIAVNVLVGDANKGEAYFGAACSKGHSVTGDLKGIGSKFSEPRALQNAWVRVRAPRSVEEAAADAAAPQAPAILQPVRL